MAMNQLKKPGFAASPGLGNGIGASRLLTDFEIVQTLGSGAFGLVCKLKSKGDKKNYAVKVVPLLFEEHDLREVDTLAKIPAHPNVVMYVKSWQDCLTAEELNRVKVRLGLGGAGGPGKNLAFRMNRGQTHLDLLCIQMELCGEDLRKWLGRQNNRVTELRSLLVFQQICAGLEHIHANDLIHRDLKPENIFFDAIDPNSLKIGDFGLAIGHTTQVSALHTRGAGTPLYWAPEQESKTYKKQVDFYPLGLILYELFEPSLQPKSSAKLGGELNFEPLVTGFNQLKFNSVLPPLLRTRWPKIAELILRLVSVQPDDRPNFREIRETLAPKTAAAALARKSAVIAHQRPQPLSPPAFVPPPPPKIAPAPPPRDIILKGLPLIGRGQPPANATPMPVPTPAPAPVKVNGLKLPYPPVLAPVPQPRVQLQSKLAAASKPVPIGKPALTPGPVDPKASPRLTPAVVQAPLPLPRTVVRPPEAPPVPKQRALPSRRSKDLKNGDEPCAQCFKPILGGEKIVEALGKVWHPEHFLCQHCQSPLKDGFYEKHGRAYCKKDFSQLYLPLCAGCLKPIESGLVTVEGIDWHRDHFCCTKCSKPIGDSPYYKQDGKVYCKPDYLKLFAPKCPGCKKAIENKYIEISEREPSIGGSGVSVDKQKWHLECLKCAKCKKLIGGFDEKAYSHDGKLYCKQDYLKQFAPKCAGCKDPIEGNHVVVRNDPRTWHNDCFKCWKCRSPIGDNYVMYQSNPICTPCHRTCDEYKNPIDGEYQTVKKDKIERVGQNRTRKWHHDCFKCKICHKITYKAYRMYGDKPLCTSCDPNMRALC